MSFSRKFEFTCDKCGHTELCPVDDRKDISEHAFKVGFAYMNYYKSTDKGNQTFYLCSECRNLFNDFISEG